MAVSTSPMLAVPAAAGVARFRRAGSASTAAPCSAPRQQHVSRSHVVGAGAAVLDSPALREVSPSSEGAEHANEPRRYVSLKPASWTPLPVPTSLGEVVSALRSPELSAAVNDPSSLAYVAYQTLRTGFFTAATFATVALAGADPASRLARNGEAPVKERGLNDVTASVLSGTPAAAMGLARVLASQAELYRRELSFIKAGLCACAPHLAFAHRCLIERLTRASADAAPYDADPRHRQWCAFIAPFFNRCSLPFFRRRTVFLVIHGFASFTRAAALLAGPWGSSRTRRGARCAPRAPRCGCGPSPTAPSPCGAA